MTTTNTMTSERPSVAAASARMVGTCHVSLWHRAADGSDVVWLSNIVRRAVLAGRRPALLIVVPKNTPLSTSAARSEAVKLIRIFGNDIAAVAVVVEGTGFWKAAVRAMFTGIGSIAQPPMPWKIFDEPRAAAGWMSQFIESSRLTLEASVAGLRRR